MARDFQNLGQGESAPVCQAFLQRHPFEKLHEDVGRALGSHACVEDFDDVAMTDGAGSPGFVEKTPDQLYVPRQGGMQDLHGGAAFDEWVLGQVDLPKTAFAE